MAQHDYVIDDGPGLAVRVDMNAAIQAMVTQNSGPIEPITKYPGMFWLDTTIGSNGAIKMRDLSNTGWTFPSIYGDDRVGEVATFARATPPVGWLKANGEAVSRTVYAALFAAIGTQFGLGDGSTTFNVPDLRGQFLRGWDDGRGLDPSRAFGSNQAGAVASHGHTATTTVAAGGAHDHAVSGSTGYESADHSHYLSAYDNVAGGHQHWMIANSNAQTSLGSNYVSLTGDGFGAGGENRYILKGSGIGPGVGLSSIEGAHQHLIGASTGGRSAAHYHSFSGASDVEPAHSHTATTTVAAGGSGAETRPTNVSLLICIRYA